MKRRTITALILLAALIPITVIEVLFPAFLAVIIVFTMIGAMEMLTMFNKKEKMPKYLMVITILLTVIFYLGIIFSSKIVSSTILDQYFFKIDLNIAILLIGLILFITMVFMPNKPVSLLSNSFLTIFYVGLSFSAITMLRMIGVRFIIYLFLITIMTDIFAYLIGSKFGKRKLAPITSPNKSIEGAIAGSVAGTIIASLFALFFNIYPNSLNPDGLQTIFSGFSQFGNLSRGLQALVVIPLTFLATCVGQIGDLAASKFKRNYQIEDFGNLFPGHGGVIDRFDSSMLTSVFLVLVLTITAVLFPL